MSARHDRGPNRVKKAERRQMRDGTVYDAVSPQAEMVFPMVLH